MKKLKLVIVLSLLIILCASLVNAGFLDRFTGHAVRSTVQSGQQVVDTEQGFFSRLFYGNRNAADDAAAMGVGYQYMADPGMVSPNVDLNGVIDSIKNGVWLPAEDPSEGGGGAGEDCDQEPQGCTCQPGLLGGCSCICNDPDEFVGFDGEAVNADFYAQFSDYVVENIDQFNVNDMRNLIAIQALMLNDLAQNIAE